MFGLWGFRLLAFFVSLQIGLGFITDARPPWGAMFAPRGVANNAIARSGDHYATLALDRLRRQRKSSEISSQLRMMLTPEELSQQKGEALRALADFNDGTWSGKATSFSITSDSAAGVTKRKLSRPYRTSVSTRFGLGGEGLKIVETFEWTNGCGGSGEESTCVATRTVPLGKSTDVDAVDGSYSVDVALLDVPSALSGTDMLVKFAIEQSLPVSDDERVRCFLLYGIDDRLARVVICEETRIEEGQSNEKSKSTYSKGDFVDTSLSEDEELATDIDRIVGKITGENAEEPPESSKSATASPLDRTTAETKVEERMERLQRALLDTKETDGRGGTERYPMDMFGLSLGVWLGDAVVRDQNVVIPSGYATGNKGFGSPTQPRKQRKKQEFGDGFAEWSMGVQKVTMTFKWDFEETCRQVMHFGRSMGASTGAVPVSSMGTINDELMSRRLKPDERMLYIDYDMGKYAGFVVGSVYIKAPRYLTFSQASSQDPFFTEFSVFCRKADDNKFVMNVAESEELADVFCSRLTRLYNKDGQLAQGSSSFFTLKPMPLE